MKTCSGLAVVGCLISVTVWPNRWRPTQAREQCSPDDLYRALDWPHDAQAGIVLRLVRQRCMRALAHQGISDHCPMTSSRSGAADSRAARMKGPW
jgi:hypothetical protein